MAIEGAAVRLPPPVRIELSASILEPARARDAATAALSRWNIGPALSRMVEIVVSELVTNAVRHTTTASEFTLRLTDRHVLVAVRDASPVQPRVGRPAVSATSGRGLFIVDRLAHSWGVHPRAPGKVVWAAFRLGDRSNGKESGGSW